MSKPMMECGHTANATDGKTGDPVCVICVGTDPGAKEIATDPPSLDGRTARCSCGEVVESRRDLPFFEFRGDGSRSATQKCVCGYYESAHKDGSCPRRSLTRKHPKGRTFTPSGAYEHDSYYCGHAGWD